MGWMELDLAPALGERCGGGSSRRGQGNPNVTMRKRGLSEKKIRSIYITMIISDLSNEIHSTVVLQGQGTMNKSLQVSQHRHDITSTILFVANTEVRPVNVWTDHQY